MIKQIERMRKLVNDNLVMGLRFQMNRELNELEREIEQELNSRAERTCHWEYPQSVNGWVGYMVCSSCGEKYDETVADLANYCPNCGTRVVE